MEYTVQKLGRLAGISTRTLRYYDEIDLLKPLRINSSGYRIYGQAEVDLLQQILFYRELGVPLDEIKAIVTSPSFNSRQALQAHHHQLLEKRKQLDLLIRTVEQTIADQEGMITMNDRQKFEGFKKELIAENEQAYGKEIRAKYGDEQVDHANQAIMSSTPEQHQAHEQLTAELYDVLARAVATGDPASELAQQAADLHRQWLSFYWGKYNKEAHAGLAQMYVDDERFTAHYDKDQPGTAVFLRDAIRIYTGVDGE
ncbi:MerR family transcriptional regulator [Paenibacillus daejeonensis]|uniref:MerR family transcriptional regulator n=1 Tax=Paenibacillus daejeonensis TaxID=135193 RepID=UPI0003797748|nr:MerR family transcriptional regulator [Paenibacillus daejeonensis]